MSYVLNKLLPFAAFMMSLNAPSVASNPKEELRSDQVFIKYPTQPIAKVSSMVHAELLQQIHQHIPADLKNYPDLYHQTVNRNFKQSLKKQYQALDELFDLAQRNESLQGQQAGIELLQQTIDHNTQQITQHEQLLALHNITDNRSETDLMRDIHATIERQRKIIEELNKNEASDEQRNRLRTAHAILENASQQSAILAIPLSQRKLEHVMLVQDLKRLSDEITRCQTVTPSSIEDRRDDHEELIANLTMIRAKSVYKLEPLLKSTKGFMFPVMLARSVFSEMLPVHGHCIAYIAQITDQPLLWRYMVNNLEFPAPYFLDPIDDLVQHYIQETQSLKTLFEQRCQEDGAALTVLCRNLDDYNKNVIQQAGSPLEFDISEFEMPERELWSYLTGQDVNREFNLIESFIKLKLTELLTTHGAEISEHYTNKLASKPIGLLGHVLASLKRGGFNSWQSDHMLLVKANAKLKNKQNPSHEIMLAFYRLLGRITNKIVLQSNLVVLQSNQSAAQTVSKLPSVKKFKHFLAED